MDIKCMLHFSLQLLDTTLCPNMWFKEFHANSAVMPTAKYEVIIQGIHYFCPTVIKISMHQQTLVKPPNMKCHTNSFIGPQVATHEQTDIVKTNSTFL
jgi:hypothetical protein